MVTHVSDPERSGLQLAVTARHANSSRGNSSKKLVRSELLRQLNRGDRGGPEPGLDDVSQVDARLAGFIKPLAGHLGHCPMALPAVLDPFLEDCSELSIEG